MLSKPTRQGPELMLRSMGLGSAIDAAQAFATNGTLDKIIQFADALPVYIAKAEQNERILRAIAQRLGVDTENVIGVAGIATVADAGFSEGGELEPVGAGISQRNGSDGTGSDPAARGDVDGASGVTDETG